MNKLEKTTLYSYITSPYAMKVHCYLLYKQLPFSLVYVNPFKIAKELPLGSATLVRHFQTTVGVSPMAYVANWRMTKAHSLVKYSNLRIEEIAEATGYLSTQTLNKAFKRHFNYTPNELRKKV